MKNPRWGVPFAITKSNPLMHRKVKQMHPVPNFPELQRKRNRYESKANSYRTPKSHSPCARTVFPTILLVVNANDVHFSAPLPNNTKAPSPSETHLHRAQNSSRRLNAKAHNTGLELLPVSGVFFVPRCKPQHVKSVYYNRIIIMKPFTLPACRQ